MARSKNGLSANVAAAWLTGATVLTGLVGCQSGPQSGSAPAEIGRTAPASVMDTVAVADIMAGIRQMGPGFASVDSKANDALTGLIADVVSNNNERNNRYLSFLYFEADGTFRKESVHALTGQHEYVPILNYQPTQRELLAYTFQQQGTVTKLMEDGPGGLLQGFKDIDFVLVRNLNIAPGQAWMMQISGWDGSLQGVRPATREEIVVSETRPSWGRNISPADFTRVRNYSPWQHVSEQRDLHRANLRAGRPYPTPSIYQNSPVNVDVNGSGSQQSQQQPAAGVAPQQPTSSTPAPPPNTAPKQPGTGLKFDKSKTNGGR
ncbi:MAG: hypothetical protein EYC62_09300 [Alphaproteobacteria bacterium]|nr:MAG: hypothetical protein EYC62_09300 [Alphaproteobacteria bacterium]